MGPQLWAGGLRKKPQTKNTHQMLHTCSEGRKFLVFHLRGLEPRRGFSVPASSEGHNVCLWVFDLKKKNDGKKGRERKRGGRKEKASPP